jgi:transcriptional regulator with XRE-family HTH domain
MLRLKAGMTQEQLARKMNVDQAAVSRWESGDTKPLKKSRKKLAKVLGCTVDELLVDTDV